MIGDNDGEGPTWPDWVPDAVRHYIRHTEGGLSIRALARDEGQHASTVMRQVRRFEQRRDDPLVDEALARLGHLTFPRADAPPSDRPPEETEAMSMNFDPSGHVCDEETVKREARRILRRLGEPGAVLAVAPGMPKAAVVRDGPDGTPTRTAVVERAVAQAFALKDWIACQSTGKVSRYTLTAAGRTALKRMLAEVSAERQGFAEDQSAFAAQHAEWGERTVEEEGKTRRIRYNMAESPVVALSRRREKDGKPFLKPEHVAAAERLREDFELAQMGPRVAQNWERFLTGGGTGGQLGPTGPGTGSDGARARVAKALRELGPGLGDMVLRCCCFLEGLEATERRMGWSARSGKIVLRIALMRLARHYEEEYGPGGGLIG